MCKQCTECGARYGHRKRTKEIVTWAKKKQRYIRREELIAFLLDKPYMDNSSSDKLDDHHGDLPMLGQRPITAASSAMVPTGLNFPSQCGNFMASPLPSPSSRRRTLHNKDDAAVLENEHFPFGVNGRKRQASGSTMSCSSAGLAFDFSSIGADAPLAKRMRL